MEKHVKQSDILAMKQELFLVLDKFIKEEEVVGTNEIIAAAQIAILDKLLLKAQ